MRVIRDNIQNYYNIYLLCVLDRGYQVIRAHIIIIIAAGTYSLQSFACSRPPGKNQLYLIYAGARVPQQRCGFVVGERGGGSNRPRGSARSFSHIIIIIHIYSPILRKLNRIYNLYLHI